MAATYNIVATVPRQGPGAKIVTGNIVESATPAAITIAATDLGLGKITSLVVIACEGTGFPTVVIASGGLTATLDHSTATLVAGTYQFMATGE